MFGVLNINKPAGWTSRDVVNRVHRLVRPEKAGHAGTLDPLATGVLVVAIGPATRLIQYSHRLPKSYRASFLLGQRSPSDDSDTDAELLPDAPIPTNGELGAAIPKFTGRIFQRPPAYSAKHVDGQRAYKKVRRGESVQLEPRPVTVHALKIVEYHYPHLALDLQCGSGTYVRAIGRDLAESLGTAAVMVGLERTAIGNLHVSRAVGIDELEGRVEELLLPPTYLLDALTWTRLTREEVRDILHGRTIPRRDRRVEPASWPDENSLQETMGVDQDGRVVSVMQATETSEFRPVCNFLSSE